MPREWIEQMDDETMTGWVWNCMLFDDSHEWSDIAGRPVKKGKG